MTPQSTRSPDSQEILARLRQLESRLGSLNGNAGVDLQSLREALGSHEQRRGKRYVHVLRETGSFALELTRAIDAKVASRITGVCEKALARFQSVALPALGTGYDRAELRLRTMEEDLIGALGRFSELRQVARRVDDRLTLAGERLDELWKQQATDGVGGWRLVMRSVSAQLELEKVAAPAFTEKYRAGANVQDLLPILSGFRCPRCGTQTVRRVKRDSLVEELLRLIFVAPYLCSTCLERSYHFRYTVRKNG